MNGRTGITVGIKWPNDLVDGRGRKLAGVLAESDLASAGAGRGPARPGRRRDRHQRQLAGRRRRTARMSSRGLAVSLRMLPGRRWTGSGCSPRCWSPSSARAADLDTPAGRSRLAADLVDRCTTIGTRVRVDLADGSFEGTATGVDPGGHLAGRDGRRRPHGGGRRRGPRPTRQLNAVPPSPGRPGIGAAPTRCRTRCRLRCGSGRTVRTSGRGAVRTGGHAVRTGERGAVRTLELQPSTGLRV